MVRMTSMSPNLIIDAETKRLKFCTNCNHPEQMDTVINADIFIENDHFQHRRYSGLIRNPLFEKDETILQKKSPNLRRSRRKSSSFMGADIPETIDTENVNKPRRYSCSSKGNETGKNIKKIGTIFQSGTHRRSGHSEQPGRSSYEDTVNRYRERKIDFNNAFLETSSDDMKKNCEKPARHTSQLLPSCFHEKTRSSREMLKEIKQNGIPRENQLFRRKSLSNSPKKLSAHFWNQEICAMSEKLEDQTISNIEQMNEQKSSSNSSRRLSSRFMKRYQRNCEQLEESADNMIDQSDQVEFSIGHEHVSAHIPEQSKREMESLQGLDETDIFNEEKRGQQQMEGETVDSRKKTRKSSYNVPSFQVHRQLNHATVDTSNEDLSHYCINVDKRRRRSCISLTSNNAIGDANITAGNFLQKESDHRDERENDDNMVDEECCETLKQNSNNFPFYSDFETDIIENNDEHFSKHCPKKSEILDVTNKNENRPLPRRLSTRYQKAIKILQGTGENYIFNEEKQCAQEEQPRGVETVGDNKKKRRRFRNSSLNFHDYEENICPDISNKKQSDVNRLSNMNEQINGVKKMGNRRRSSTSEIFLLDDSLMDEECCEKTKQTPEEHMAFDEFASDSDCEIDKQISGYNEVDSLTEDNHANSKPRRKRAKNTKKGDEKVPNDTKKYYLNKKIPKSSNLETIFEIPENDIIMSRRKYKRAIDFDAFNTATRLRKRKRKAKKVNSFSLKSGGKSAKLDAILHELFMLG